MDWSIVISIVSLIGTVSVFILGKVFKIYDALSKVETHEKKVEKLSEDVSCLHDNMIRVQTILSLKHKGMDGIFSEKNSPRTLTPLGIEMYNKMSGDEFLSNNKELLFRKISDRNPMTALDVEFASQWTCEASVNEAIFNPIKDFVYNCPMLKLEDGSEREFTLGDACFILGIKLRDLYLAEIFNQEHKNQDVSDD